MLQGGLCTASLDRFLSSVWDRQTPTLPLYTFWRRVSKSISLEFFLQFGEISVEAAFLPGYWDQNTFKWLLRIVETGRGTLIWFINLFHLFLCVNVVGLCGRVTPLNRTERWGVKVVDNFLRFLVNKLYLTKTRKKTRWSGATRLEI